MESYPHPVDKPVDNFYPQNSYFFCAPVTKRRGGLPFAGAKFLKECQEFVARD